MQSKKQGTKAEALGYALYRKFPFMEKKMLQLLNLDDEQPTCPQFQQTGLLHPRSEKLHYKWSNQVPAFPLISWKREHHFILQLFNFISKYTDNKVSLLLPCICLNCKSFPFTILLPFTLLCRQEYCLQVVYTVWALLLIHDSLKQTLLKQHSPLVWM